MKILDRLAGLETEYVIRFHPDAATAARTKRPHNRSLFDLVIGELRRVLPALPAMPGKPGFFLANGGAVWYEHARHTYNAALLEGSTPECRGPRQLLAYQRAQDALFATAARDVSIEAGDVTLCKSDRDAAGHMYGSQENYECTLANGWRWHGWRAGLVLLTPTLLLMWVGICAALLVIVAYYALAGLLFPIVAGARWLLAGAGWRVSDDAALRRAFFGHGLKAAFASDSELDFLPTWLYTLVYLSFHVITLPTAIGLTVLGRLTAFVDVRRQLTPFLVTRAVVAGSGRLVAGDRYEIAAKASALNSTAATNEVLGVRPMFSFGHFIKAFALGAFASSTKFRPLLLRRQRLQISLGDGNLCEEAEYLRIGTTLLVIDAIESGSLPPVPRFRWPLRAMRRLIADPTLRATVRTRGGRRMTAVEVQRFYLDACRAFVARQPDAPPEAADILRRWGEVLDLLEHDRSKLVGRVDWVTKQFLLHECGGGADERTATWAARKKIDLRYHELSTDGYFHRLREAGASAAVLNEREIEDAMRNPPPDTAAAVRGRYVREFATDPTARASWQCITLGTAPELKVLDLRRHSVAEGSTGTPTAPASQRSRAGDAA